MSKILGVHANIARTKWQDLPSNAAGVLITGTTSNPSYGGTIVTNKAQWMRDGEYAVIKWDYHHTSAGSDGSGVYLLNIPGIIGVVDTSKVTVNSNINQGLYANMDSGVGRIYWASSAGYSHVGVAVVHSNTQIKFHVSYTGAGQGGIIWGHTTSSWANSEMCFSTEIRVPIVGWTDHDIVPVTP